MHQNSRQNLITGLSNEDVIRYKQLFLGIALKICPAFTVRPEHREAVNDIFRWCMMLDGKLDVNKGLWLYGNVGTGKSTMLGIVKEFCRIVRPWTERRAYSFYTANAVDICAEFQSDGYEGLRDYVSSRRLAIDELGSETIPTAYFGNNLNVIQHLLQSRYDNRFNSFTHVTTNRSISEISKLYTPRIWDRCKEMFNFVEFTGKTFRK